MTHPLFSELVNDHDKPTKVLTEVNNHHLDEEEEDIFEHLKKMPDSRLDQLLDRFRQGKESHR